MLNRSRSTVLFTALAALMTVFLIIPFFLFLDIPVAQAVHPLKGTFAVKVGNMISWLASKNVIQTVTFFLLLAGALDGMIYGFGRRARSILLLALAPMAAMLIGDELKWFFGRYRPPVFFENGSYGFTWFSSEYMQNSFPSGHTLRAFSLASVLAFVLSRKKYIPLIVAVLVGISRVVVGRHYPSDVMFGGFIGVTCAVWGHYYLFREE
ncbi:phosphatase PAP2 family protein [Maridesulfovibrio sp. FT414]|uniref:phosphatase PAP2 family protein n=1 Tax=Maridesulfovibrio sp. FT414 TaxID=2979469 RepID=UPI003D804A00